MDKKEEKTTQTKEAPLMHTFDEKPASKSASKATSLNAIVISLIVVAVLGIGTGFVLSKISNATGKQLIPVGGSGSVMLTGKIFGSNDLTTFKDIAEGKVAEGGIEGEGQYHLIRPGGDSQNVYMTSSFVDLSQFVGRKIKVWGQTQSAQHAGWLMDVGRVEVQ